jgi:hypothetical protein
MKSLFLVIPLIFVSINSSQAENENHDDKGEYQIDPPPPNMRLNTIRVGSASFVDRRVSMQTEVALDSESTAYLLTIFGNGTVRTMRISRREVVKQLILYRGWPYILDKKGNLFAMDISWKTMMKNKMPMVMQRLTSMRTFLYASGFGVTGFSLAWFNNYIHSGGLSSEYSPDYFGPTSFALYYLWDAVMTTFVRSHYKVAWGGNFFTRQIAKNVESLEYSSGDQDYLIRYRKSQLSDHLNQLASESPDAGCMFKLSILNNQ